MARLDICICTFNRSSYLKRCLEALVPQIVRNQVAIIIIDNGSTDETKSMLKLYEHHIDINIFEESTPGLSHARNKGWKVSDADWICYIDDDCLPRTGFIQNALAIIAQKPAETAIGGPVYPLFENTPPQWLPVGFGHFNMPFQTYTPIAKGYIRGGCMMINRNFLEKTGGFNTDLGVRQRKLRYGEEIELQERIRKLNGSIAYTPSLAIDHFVRPEKINTAWILHSEYARRRDKMKITPLPLLPLTIKLSLTLMKTVVVLPVHWMKALVSKNYTMQKANLDALIPMMYRTGEWWGVISREKKRS